MTGSVARGVSGPPEPALVLDVWADVVCPWCYIAKHRLRRAIDGWERPHQVRVRHRAYQLDPGMPKGRAVPVAQYLGEKYGGGPEAGAAVSSPPAPPSAPGGGRVEKGPGPQ